MLRRSVIGAVLGAACHDATDAEKQRVIGDIDLLGTNPPTIVAPRGRRGPARAVRHHPDLRPQRRCRDDWIAHAHAFGVTLTRPGMARLRVVGRRAARAEDVLDSLEVAVTVTP